MSSRIWGKGMCWLWAHARKIQNGIDGPFRDGDAYVVQSILCSILTIDDKLKKRIEAASGPVLDKMADALMESISKDWQAMIQKSSAKKEFHEKLAKIMSESSQKQK